MRNLAFNIDVKGNAAPIEQMDKATDKLKDSAQGAGKNLQAMGKSMQSTGKKLTKGLTLPIVGIGVAAMATVANFDDSMANVQKISGATGKEFDNLRDKAKELGSTTAYSASEAAEGMGVLAASGMETNDILAVSGDMFNLMSAGSIDAETAASILTNTMAQFNLTAEESGYIVDTFAATSAKSKVGVQDLEHMMSQAGATLAGMNMNVVESTASFGHLANAGMPVKQLGTTINAMGREVSANAGDFKKLGVEVYDSQGKAKGLDQVMADLEKTMVGKTDSEIDAAMATVFSGQAMQGAKAWLDQGSDAYSKLTEEIIKETNAAETMAAIQEDTVGGAFRAVKSAMEGMMIEIGDVIKKPVQEIAKFIAKAAGAFGKLSDPMKKVVIAVATVAAAIGPLMFIGGKVIEIGPKIAGVFTKIGGVIGGISLPVVFVVAAIAGLVAILVHLWKTNEEFRDKVIAIWDTIKESLGQALEFIKGLWTEHGEAIKGKVTEIFEVISEVVLVAFEWITENIGIALEWIKEMWDIHGESILEGITTTWNFITETIGIAVEVFTEIITTALTWIQEFWSEHGEQIKEIASGAWEMITEVIGIAIDVVVEIVTVALNWIQEFWSTHGTTITTIAQTAWGVIQGVIEGAMNIIQGVINVVLGVIQGDWTRVWHGIQQIFEGVMTAIKAAWNGVKTLLGIAIKGTVNAITDAFHTAMDKVKEKWEGVKTFLKNPIKGTVSLAQKGASAVKGFFGGNFKTGLDKVPYDDFPANLHKNEMVLTSSASDQYRSMGGTKDGISETNNDYSISNATTKSITKEEKAPVQFNFNPRYDIEINGNTSENEAKDLISDIDRKTRRTVEKMFKEFTLQMG